jgi:outer membrane receptor protein involved in Fe transport
MTPQTDNHLSARIAIGGLAAASPFVLAVVLASASPVQARAAELRAFRLPAEPLESALLRFAVQAGVSVGGLPARGCGGTSRPVVGAMAPEQALAALLPHGCGFERPDARSFRIVARPTAPSAPVREPAAPVAQQVRLDELVVTAEKRAERLSRSASAVSVQTAGDIEALGAATFDEVAPQMVSVAVTNLGPGRNKIFVRGLSDGSFTGKTQSTVGLYLDDVPITYNAPDPDLRLVDVDRVEVLRGPQGTLYGSGSIGGIVRIVTARPNPAQAAAALSAEVKATAHGQPSEGVDGMFNLPLAGGRAAVRAVAYSDQRGGYIDNPVLGLRDVNSSRRWGGRLAGLAELPDGWTVQAGLARQSISTADSQYTQGPAGPLTRDAAVREPHDNDFAELGAQAEHAGEGADLKVSTAFIDHQLGTRYDATGAFRAAGGSLTGGAFDEDKRVRLWVTEGLMTSSTPARLRWLAGAFVSYANEMDAAALVGVTPPEPARSIYRRRDRLSEAAVYGELTYDLTPKLSATVGARWFETRVSTQAGDFSLARDPLPPMAGRLTDQGVAPKLRLSYAVTADAVVYLQMQEGYRAGGFNIPAAAGGGLIPERAAAQFRPDHLWNYELGASAPLRDGTLLLRGAIFYADWRGLQTDQRLATGLPFTVNVGDGSNVGVEAEALWRPDEHLQVRANLLLEEPQITRAADVFPARRDIGLPGVPFDMGGGSVRYRWPLGERLAAELTGQFAYVGRSYLTFDGGASNRMGGYGSGRVSAALAGGRWRVTAYVDNVADARGNTFAFGNPFSRARFTQATPLRPRTVGLSLGRSF